jgi:hypothetical protein
MREATTRADRSRAFQQPHGNSAEFTTGSRSPVVQQLYGRGIGFERECIAGFEARWRDHAASVSGCGRSSGRGSGRGSGSADELCGSCDKLLPNRASAVAG